jgi:winged helix DNA-binding protein
MVSVSWRGVSARRMARSYLTEPAVDARPSDIATALVGVHAQVLAAAELSIGRRIAGATRTDVQRALWEERSLVKTFGPRGTVHLVATADLAMWTGALSALPSTPNHPEPVRFDTDQVEQVLEAIGDALADGPLTVDELTAALEDRLGPWAVERTMDAFQVKWPRWRQLTATAAHRGLLCFGPDRDRNVTYVHPATWLPDFRPDDGQRAARTLLARYLIAYGPVTPQHFARWLAIPPRQAVDLFETCAADLELVDFEGQPGWVSAGDAAMPGEPPSGLRLLPYFDAFVVASQPRERLFPGTAASRAQAGGGAGNYPVVLVDGIVCGVWHQRRLGGKVQVTVELLNEITPSQLRELEDEVELVGRVLEATPTLAIGPVAVGAHA